MRLNFAGPTSYFVPDNTRAYGDASGLSQWVQSQPRYTPPSQASTASAQDEWDSLRLSAGPRGGAGTAYGDPPAITREEELRELIAYSEIRLDRFGEQPAEFWAARAEALNLAAQRYRALNTEPGTPFTTDAIYNTLRADAMQARILAGAGLANSDLNQSVQLLLESGAVGIGAARATTARPTVQLGVSPSAEEVRSAIQRLSREGHALDRHGEHVTIDDLRTRVDTGVAPDGSSRIENGRIIIPPYASSFYSNDLLAASDLYIRQNFLDRALSFYGSRNINRITLEGVEIGIPLGRSVERIGREPQMTGPFRQIENLVRVNAVYTLDRSTNTWKTLTIYPTP